MSAHVHDWHPFDGHAGGYDCTCGAYGHRPRYGGAIRQLARRPWWAGAAAATARGQSFRQAVGGACPNLDQQERR